MSRQSRKLDHLKYTLLLEDGPNEPGFDDLNLVHNCLPNVDLDSIDLTTSVAGLRLKHPIIVNAMTGGALDVLDIHSLLAEFAKKTNSAMAVGSQFAAIENPELIPTYSIVRKIYPDGIIFANIGAYATPDQAARAVEMIEANAIQIHFNAAQEIMMTEGDRNFKGYLENLQRIVDKVNVPVIAKEVGFGIAREQVAQLINAGVAAIDIGGSGGTNFLAIEAARINKNLSQDELRWGIPTVVSAIETKSVLAPGVSMIVSGGVRRPLDIIKSLVLGGSAVGIAGMFLKMLQRNGLNNAILEFNQMLDTIKKYMLILGINTIDKSSSVPLVIGGQTRQWMQIRNCDITKYAVKKQDLV